jgi:hypothetical protein
LQDIAATIMTQNLAALDYMLMDHSIEHTPGVGDPGPGSEIAMAMPHMMKFFEQRIGMS